MKSDICPKCSSELAIGVYTDYDNKEKVFKIYPSNNINTKSCVKCYITFCNYCNHVDYNYNDICMNCNADYCDLCAEKWEVDTGMDFMYGDYNICIKCYEACDNKAFYIKRKQQKDLFMKCYGKYCYFCDNKAVDVCKKCNKFLCNNQCDMTTKCCS